MSNASCSGQRFGHSFPYGGADCLQCGINQNELSYGRPKEEPVGRSIFDGYLEKIITRPRSKAQNYMQELMEPYLPFIDWSNETLDADMRALYVATSRFWKVKTPHEFTRLLEWVKKKNTLHPKQVVKLFTKQGKNEQGTTHIQKGHQAPKESEGPSPKTETRRTTGIAPKARTE